MEIDNLFTEIWNYLIVAVVLPAFTPFLHVIDAKRRKEDIRTELENIKLMMEVELSLYPDNKDSIIKFYADEFERISASMNCKSYWNSNADKSCENTVNPFDIGDIIASLSIPVLLFLLLVPSSSENREQIEFALITGLAGAISFYFTKEVICKKIKSDLVQKAAAFLVSILSLLPGMMIVLIFSLFIAP